jgi:bifunctional oligoribonuclease and PAP phosphatase NrnA
MPIADSTQWDALVEALRSSSRTLLLGHISPDADALGSALAVGLALKSVGHDVTVSFGDEPCVLSRALRSLPGQELIVPAIDIQGPFDVVVSFDTASVERLGLLEPLTRSAGLFACLDHHASNQGIAHINIIDIDAPATAVLALKLIDRLHLPLTQDIAAALYAGLSTDTGSFRFISTTPDTHRVAARLLETGMQHHLVARAMYDDEDFSSVRLLGAGLARATLDSDALEGLGVVWTFVTADERQAAEAGLEQVERVIDQLRITTEAEVAVVLKQGDDLLWRASVRSKGGIDVGAAMVSIAGGGHRYAAGATLDVDLESAVREVLNALEKVATA